MICYTEGYTIQLQQSMLPSASLQPSIIVNMEVEIVINQKKFRQSTQNDDNDEG